LEHTFCIASEESNDYINDNTRGKEWSSILLLLSVKEGMVGDPGRWHVGRVKESIGVRLTLRWCVGGLQELCDIFSFAERGARVTSWRLGCALQEGYRRHLVECRSPC
jgi:hypothetical protein